MNFFRSWYACPCVSRTAEPPNTPKGVSPFVPIQKATVRNDDAGANSSTDEANSPRAPASVARVDPQVAEVANGPCSPAAARPSVSPQTPAQEQWVSDLVHAAAAGDEFTLSRLLKRQAPEAPPDLIEAQVELSDGWSSVTALFAAAAHGEDEVLEVLLEAGASPGSRGLKTTELGEGSFITEDDTALCIAAKENKIACVEALLKAGADANALCTMLEHGDGASKERATYSALDAAGSPEAAEAVRKGGGLSKGVFEVPKGKRSM